MSWKDEVREILRDHGLTRPTVDHGWKKPMRTALNSIRLKEARAANPSKATKAWKMNRELKVRRIRVVVK